MTPVDYGNYCRLVCELLGGSSCETWLSLYANEIKRSFGIPFCRWAEWEVKLSYVGAPTLYVIHSRSDRYVFEDGSFGEWFGSDLGAIRERFGSDLGGVFFPLISGFSHSFLVSLFSPHFNWTPFHSLHIRKKIKWFYIDTLPPSLFYFFWQCPPWYFPPESLHLLQQNLRSFSVKCLGGFECAL